MIARIWHGVVPAAKAEAYLELMRAVALPEYLATQGIVALGVCTAPKQK
jgi:hypothetical protein